MKGGTKLMIKGTVHIVWYTYINEKDHSENSFSSRYFFWHHSAVMLPKLIPIKLFNHIYKREVMLK